MAAAAGGDADSQTAGTRVVLKRTCVYASDAERREKPAPVIATRVPPELGPRDGAISSKRAKTWYSKSTSSRVKSWRLRLTSIGK